MIVTDQINHKVNLNKHPKRIVSLVPSQTELLYELGLEENVVGITKFCVHPEHWLHTKKRVGGTKNLNFDKIADLNPDLIIANKEENTREQIEKLQELYPVYTSDISNLEESLEMIHSIAKMTNTKTRGLDIVKDIKHQFGRLTSFKSKTRRVLYLIWKDPYMTINEDTFINDMMLRCGLQNVISSNEHYPVITEKEIRQLDPDIIFLSSEPFPFKEEHKEEFQIICPDSRIMLVDGEFFSWYGSRLRQAVDYFIGLMKKMA